jgi:hypothetical protein
MDGFLTFFFELNGLLTEMDGTVASQMGFEATCQVRAGSLLSLVLMFLDSPPNFLDSRI